MSERIVSPKQNNDEDENFERSLRPNSLAEVIGRNREKEALKIMIEAAKSRGEAVDHILFHGPPGLGKTSLSFVIANEMGVPIYTTSGPAIERQGDLAAILTNIEENGILFIDEIHRLNKTIEEILYPAMEDRVIDIIIGKGPSAKTLRLDLNKFTVVGATTRMSLVSAPLRDRFGVDFRLDYYSHDELQKLVMNKAKILGIEVGSDSAMEIAKRARRTPRLAERLLKRVRDYSQVKNNNIVDLKSSIETLKMLEIDEFGLDYLDRKIIKTMADSFAGGPVGLSTLAASVNEDLSTIEDV
ncbi:MAG: Holliday junction branch migration DNA helicase RuvB, partial [Ignavibacteriae bacterium]|nr:Holliday junction branch migration DNA helicase RuvB [Ignavibacteriota bacterium]